MKENNHIQQISKFYSTRTTLYSLKPEGLGTPYIESLTSYLSRLASIHCLSVASLLRGVIEPVLEIQHIKEELKIGNSKSSALYIGQNNAVTLDYIKALEQLTGRDDIQFLSMINWRGIFQREVLSNYRKWCPACLEEMRVSSKIIYEPLLWYISSVKNCDIHGAVLQKKCPYCESKLSLIHSKISMGYCSICNEWLGKRMMSEGLEKYEQFVISNFKELLVKGQKVNFFPSEQFLYLFLNQKFNESGFKSKKIFADFLKIKPMTFYNWIANRSKPKPDFLLNLSCNFKYTIYQMIYEDNIKIEVDVKKFNENPKKPCSKEEMEKVLKEALNSNKGKSLSEISKASNFTYGRAISNFPELCFEIREKYLEKKDKDREFYKESLRIELVNTLLEEVPISMTEFSRIRGYPLKTVRRYEPDLARAISRRYNDFIKKRKQILIEKTINEVEIIANRLHEEGLYPSTARIVKELENGGVFMYKEVSSKWYEIITELGYKNVDKAFNFQEKNNKS